MHPIEWMLFTKRNFIQFQTPNRRISLQHHRSIYFVNPCEFVPCIQSMHLMIIMLVSCVHILPSNSGQINRQSIWCDLYCHWLLNREWQRCCCWFLTLCTLYVFLWTEERFVCLQYRGKHVSAVQRRACVQSILRAFLIIANCIVPRDNAEHGNNSQHCLQNLIKSALFHPATPCSESQINEAGLYL